MNGAKTMFRLLSVTAILAAAVSMPCGCDGGSPDSPEEVREADITVDGDASDWAAIKPVYRDAEGDATSSLPGADVTAVYLVRNGDDICVRLDLAEGPPASNMRYRILFGSPQEGVRDRPVIEMDAGPLRCRAWYERASSGPELTRDGRMAVRGTVIEAVVSFDGIPLGDTCRLTFRAQRVNSAEMDIFDTVTGDDGAPEVMVEI